MEANILTRWNLTKIVSHLFDDAYGNQEFTDNVLLEAVNDVAAFICGYKYDVRVQAQSPSTPLVNYNEIYYRYDKDNRLCEIFFWPKELISFKIDIFGNCINFSNSYPNGYI